MKPADYESFCEVVVGFAELRGKQLSKAALKLYWQAMQDWRLDEFREAAEHLLRTSEFMPTPKQFEDLRTAGEPTAAEAWTIVLSGAPLPPGSRMHRAAEACGGQVAIRHENVERSLPFTQKRFIDAYEDLTRVDPVREDLPQIAVHGARRALSAPTNIAAILPAELTPRLPQPVPVALPSVSVVSTPAKVTTPPKSAREKIVKLLPLQMTDEATAKVAGESIDVVRQVRAEQECTA